MDELIKQAGVALGYTKLYQQQIDAIKGYCEGKDVFFCAPTGAGNLN